jgi:hypothetical protein
VSGVQFSEVAFRKSLRSKELREELP